MKILQSMPPVTTPRPMTFDELPTPSREIRRSKATLEAGRLASEPVCQRIPAVRQLAKALQATQTVRPDLVPPTPFQPRVLVLHQRDLKVGYRYVAGQAQGAGQAVPQQAGELIVGEGKRAGALELLDVVEAVLAAIEGADPSAPPEQRARFQSLALRLEAPGVPYWMRAIFIDVGQCPTVPNATARTVVLAASRHRVACEVEGAEQPTLREALAALRDKLVREAEPAQTPVSHKVWQRPVR